MWEAGLGSALLLGLDLNAGYRYLDTKLDDDNNIKYRGFLVGLTYRFGGIRQKLLLSWKNRLLLWKNRSKNRPMSTMTTIWTAFILPLMMISHFLLNGTRWTIFVPGYKVIRILPESTVWNTDSDASDAYNEDLSKRRVDHVAQYVSNNGVSSDRLKLNYKGEKDPVASNATEQGKADNRHVDVWEHK